MSANGNAGRQAEIEALKASGLLSVLSTPEGRAKVSSLSQRVQESKERSGEEVANWDTERKMEFFRNFGDQPLLQILKEQGEDPMAKIAVFLEMPDHQLDAAMQLLYILSENDAALLKEVRSKILASAESGAAPSKEVESHNWINTVATVMASLTSLRRPNAQQHSPQCTHDHGHDHGHAQGHGHDHSHDHGHDHGHGHGHGQPMMNLPDLSTQRANTMER